MIWIKTLPLGDGKMRDLFVNPMEGYMNLDPTAQMALAGFGIIIVITVGLLVFFVTRKMSR